MSEDEIAKLMEEGAPRCYFCDKIVNSEMYCHGCGNFVCDGCDETGVFGSHDVEDHKNS
ncbi:unnamed protein product [marine sediment metagenome]|uniref:B box-type domain-containing protein n=1 Tax=marine sediment metagenome TaxID=412755 RepID=X1MJK0_9ZZZZ